MQNAQLNVKLNFRCGRPDPGNAQYDQRIREQLEYDQALWANRSHRAPQDRPFPKFDKNAIGGEVLRIQKTLLAKANASAAKKQRAGLLAAPEGILPLTTRDSSKKNGMLLPSPNKVKLGSNAANAEVQDSIQAQDINNLITEELMSPYFDEAAATLNPNAASPGIRHDDEKKKCWLPGLFLLDEIFSALLSKTWQKIVTLNDARENSPWPKTNGTFKRAKDDLDLFVQAISQNLAVGDAAQFVPFINYDTPGETYVKLLGSTNGYIIGAIVHVNDWAGGSHSSGSGIP